MKILITSALPYVNNVPHLGNIIGCVLSADVFARYCHSKEYEYLYVCGTDEYGTATEIKALEEDVSPKEICDKYYAIHKDIYEWFGIKFDIFGRTSTEKHTQITQDIFHQLYKNGYIVDEETEQFYDEKADMFLADRYIEGTCPYCSSQGARSDQCDKCGRLLQHGELLNPLSKVTKTAPVIKKTKHLFIDLPGIEKRLAIWVDPASKSGFWSENSTQIARSWLKEGLKKRAITRDLKWGVRVPLSGYEKKVFYVWFDAPIGYISITANLTENWKDWWMNPDDTRLYQFMGKDNVPFHTVIFPSTLMGTNQNWTLLHHISTTEFLNYEGGKFSKSRSVGVFGDDAKNSGIGADVWRYYLLANRPEQADTNFLWQDFADKNNNELLANLGNLVNRTLVFLANNFEGVVPAQGELSESDRLFINEQKKISDKVGSSLESVKIKDALHLIMAFSKNANRYFQENKPWESIKKDKVKTGTTLYILLQQVRDLAIMIQPFLPKTSTDMFLQLNLSEKKWKDISSPLNAGSKIGQPKTLFRKIENKEIEDLKKKFAGKREGLKGEVHFTDLDLEVGEILSCEKHPDAEKLFVERVKLSDGERQIVSGLVGYYLPEELIGKKVVVLKNLSSAKLRGVESCGMVLAAERNEQAPSHGGKAPMEKDALELLFSDVEVGEKVMIKSSANTKSRTITIKEFEKIKIEVKNFVVCFNGEPLFVGGKELKLKNVKEGVVG